MDGPDAVHAVRTRLHAIGYRPDGLLLTGITVLSSSPASNRLQLRLARLLPDDNDPSFIPLITHIRHYSHLSSFTPAIIHIRY